MKALWSKFKKLAKPETWLKPKNIIYLVLAWLLLRTGELGYKWCELKLESNFKSAGISVEYRPIQILTTNSLEWYALTNGCGPFERGLDDVVLSDYFVVPITIRNFTRNPIEKVRLDFKVGNPYAKVIDVRHVTRAPKMKDVIVRTDLPKLRWKWPTNETIFTASIPIRQQGWRINFYYSMAKDRGFGRIGESPTGGNECRFLFAPSREPRRWYVRVSSENAWGESELSDMFVTPNPIYLTGFGDTINAETNAPPINRIKERELEGFIKGEVIVTFETGLDPWSELDLHILGKAAPGLTLRPIVKMEGSPGVLFREENRSQSFTMPEEPALDETKRLLMPRFVKGTTISDEVVIYWDVLDVTNYAGVRIFRSPERSVGDFSTLGDEIFAGYGETNSFEINETLQQPQIEGAHATTTLDKFIQSPPIGSQITQGSAVKSSLAQSSHALVVPSPPTGLQASIGQTFTGLLHFVDKPSRQNVRYTYTVYASDYQGQTSYPVVLNVALDPAATNKEFLSPIPGTSLIRVK